MPGIDELYASHANRAIDYHIKHDDIKQISRARVETQLLENINNDSSLAIEFKISWAHAILYTTEFDSLWKLTALTHNLPSTCLERLEPNTDLYTYELPPNMPMPPLTKEDNPTITTLTAVPSSPPLPSPVSSSRAPARRIAPPKRKRGDSASSPVVAAPSPSPAIDESNPYARPKPKSFRRPRGTIGPKRRSLPRRSSASAAGRQKKKAVAAVIEKPVVQRRVPPPTLTEENVCGVVEGSDDEEDEESDYDLATDPKNMEMAARLGERRMWGTSPSVEREVEDDATEGKGEGAGTWVGTGFGTVTGAGAGAGVGKASKARRQKTQQEIEDDELFGISDHEQEEEGDKIVEESGVAGNETQDGVAEDHSVNLGLRGGGGQVDHGMIDEPRDVIRYTTGRGKKRMIDESGFVREEGDDGAYGSRKSKSALKKGKGGGRSGRVTRSKT